MTFYFESILQKEMFKCWIQTEWTRQVQTLQSDHSGKYRKTSNVRNCGERTKKHKTHLMLDQHMAPKFQYAIYTVRQVVTSPAPLSRSVHIMSEIRQEIIKWNADGKIQMKWIMEWKGGVEKVRDKEKILRLMLPKICHINVRPDYMTCKHTSVITTIIILLEEMFEM